MTEDRQPSQNASGWDVPSANRALAVRGSVSRSLVSATDEAAMLAEVCRLTVDEAGYSGARVCGPELPAIGGAGAGAAEDIPAAAWESLRRGEQSLVRALPDGQELVLALRTGGSLLGAWAIRTAQPFAPDEMVQLFEAARDLAWCIGALRDRRELQRANRALTTLSAVNHALLRAQDEASLLREVCRAIVEHAGYHIALVAWAEQGPDKRIRPAAWWGVEENPLADRTMTWADDERGQHALPRAIRTGEVQVVRDIFTDPHFPQWALEQARARGCASEVALPLAIEGTVAGALVIFAPEPDAFDAHELDLLQETAEDLAFGIETLRLRERSRQAQETIKRMAWYDALTGLPNRARLAVALDESLAASAARGRPLALLMLGLDRFREINESLGYRQGDLVLREVARRLVAVAGAAERLARAGEAKFAILLPDGDAGAALRLAARAVEALAEPVACGDVVLHARASIGIAVFPGHGSEAEVLIRRANLAVQQARQAGSGPALYTGGLDRESERRLALIGALHGAMERDELRLFCQPKARLADRRLCGAEALVRWEHPQLGLMSPHEFIALAESTGLINPLTDWVMQAAFRQRYAWSKAGLCLPLAVNLSARDLHDAKLAERVRDLIATWGAQPDWVQFELTESAIMQDPAAALARLTELKAIGCELFIDDFGTGYSSLAYLQKLPVDGIKIDQSFVSEMLTDRDSAIIVSSTINLAHHLQLQVVAEGVSDEACWEKLAAEGCDVAQGYAISPPLPAATFAQWQAGSSWML